MTEKTWRQHVRPTAMLLFLRATVSERRILLFNCACCRSVWNRLGVTDREATVQAEQGADDPDAIRTLQRSLEPEQTAALALVGLRDDPVSDNLRAVLTSQTNLRLGLLGNGWGIGSLAHEAAQLAANTHSQHDQRHAQESEELKQTTLLRDIFGNPFRPVAFDPAWRTDTALALARSMYESREFSAMPILADALQDAGCDSDNILNHCREPGTHVRGCWVVDLVLGKM